MRCMRAIVQSRSMKRTTGLALSLLVFIAASAGADFREFQNVPPDPALELALRRTAEQTLKDFPKLTADNLAMTLVDVTKSDVISRADYHGNAPFYPASVVKLFFMAEVFHQNRQNEPDVDRALREM